MITFLSRKHVANREDGKEEVIAIISVGASSELPPNGVHGDTVMIQGSAAWDIAAGEWYGFVNDSWVKQPTPLDFGFYEGV